LSVDIPSSAVTPVDIKSDFVPWIARSEKEAPVLLRLLFPEGIHSLIVPSDLVPGKLVEHTVHKIRGYMRTSRNASYMHQKLLSIFRQRDLSLKEIINAILSTPDQAIATVTAPNDFTFQFWTQLSSNVIREFTPKQDKLPEEHSFVQAAYMLGYFNVYFRGIQQKNLERETALKQFEVRLKKKPYAFTISDMYNFTDARGNLLSKKYPVEAIHEILSKKTTPPDNRSLPEIIRVRTAQKKEYYISKEYILPVFGEKLFLTSEALKEYYAEAWSDALRRDETLKSMTEEAAFVQDVKSRVTERDPLLAALMNYDLLYLCAKESGLTGSAANEVNQLLDRKESKLKPVPELLGLDRQKLYRDALLLLPFWQAIPVLRSFVRLLQRMFLGKPNAVAARNARARRASTPAAGGSDPAAPPVQKIAVSEDDPEPGATARESDSGSTTPDPAARNESIRTKKAQAAAFRQAIQKLEKTFLPPGLNRDAAMKLLVDKWNPILDSAAKQNLVEDVNSLVRDYVRRIRSGFRIKAPDAARIRNMARELCDHEALKKIGKRDSLQAYVELYLLKILGK
jgi:hypothetical protein